MFSHEDLDPIFNQFHQDMVEINETHRKRIRQINRRSNIGRMVALGLVFAGAAIVSRNQK